MSDTSSSKLSNNTVKVADGYYCDQKLRIGGIIFLEALTDKGFEEVAEDIQVVMKKQASAKVSVSAMVKAIEPFILSLMHQCQPDATAEELTAVIHKLELDEYMGLFNKLKLFADSGKNEDRPAAKIQRTRQPVNRKKLTGPKSS